MRTLTELVAARASASRNSAEMARGTRPRSEYAFTPPLMVYVLPLPVCPYANTVPL